MKLFYTFGNPLENTTFGNAVGLIAVIIFFKQRGLKPGFSRVLWLVFGDMWISGCFWILRLHNAGRFRGLIQNVKPNLVYHKPPTSQHPFPVSSCLRKVMKGFLETSPQ